MKRKLALLLLLGLIGLPAAMHGQVITGFGTGQFNQTFSYSATLTQSATSLHVVGTDGAAFVGSVPTATIPVNTTQLLLTGTLAGTAPLSNFLITLMDTEDHGIDFRGNWSDFTLTGTSMTVVLNLVNPASFNGTIAYVGLDGGGSDATLDFTFDQLSAIPEPVVGGLVATALLLLGLRKRHRRRSSAFL